MNTSLMSGDEIQKMVMKEKAVRDAAPDLLKALKMMVGQFESENPIPYAEIQKMALIAIEKAERKQP